MRSEIGERIRSRRLELDNMTQAELAKAVGVTRGAVSLWETDDEKIQTAPQRKHHVALARALKTSVDWLLTGNGQDRGLSDNQSFTVRHQVAILGAVGLGHWTEPGARMSELPVSLPAFPTTRYPEARQYSFALRGDDLIETHPGADWLYVVSINEVSHRLSPGDIVVVRSTREGLEERSCWSVTQSTSGLILTSQSKMDRARRPIPLLEIERDPSREITHLVVGFAGSC